MSVKLSLILGVLASVTAHADPIVFESPERQTALLEWLNLGSVAAVAVWTNPGGVCASTLTCDLTLA